MAAIISWLEQIGYPDGLTLMPTTSPGSKNRRQASCQAGAPVSSHMPLRTIAWMAAALYFPFANGLDAVAATTLPGCRPGIENFDASPREETPSAAAPAAPVNARRTPRRVQDMPRLYPPLHARSLRIIEVPERGPLLPSGLFARLSSSEIGPPSPGRPCRWRLLRLTQCPSQARCFGTHSDPAPRMKRGRN